MLKLQFYLLVILKNSIVSFISISTLMSIFHAHPAPLPLLQLLLFKIIIGWRSGAGEMKIETNIWIL